MLRLIVLSHTVCRRQRCLCLRCLCLGCPLGCLCLGCLALGNEVLTHADVRPLYAFIVYGVKRKAQQLLLVQLLHNVHGLLAGGVICAIWEMVFEPTDLTLTEKFPDWEKTCCLHLAEIVELLLSFVGLRGQVATPVG